jgi:hypothetical protein
MIVKKIRFLNNLNTDIVTFEVEIFSNSLEDRDLFIYIQLGDEKMRFPRFLKKSINSRIVGNSNFYYYTCDLQEYSEDIRNIIRNNQNPERFSNVKIRYYITDAEYENIIEKGVFVDTDGSLTRADTIQGLEENADLLSDLERRFSIIPCYNNQFRKFSNISDIDQINNIKIRFNSGQIEHELSLEEFSILNNFLFTNKIFEFFRGLPGNYESIISTYKNRIVSIIDNSEFISPSSSSYLNFENTLLVKEELDNLIFNNSFQHVDIEIYIGNFNQFITKRFEHNQFTGLDLIREFLLDLLEESRIQTVIENITGVYDNNKLSINFNDELSDFYSNSFITSIKVYNNLTRPTLQKDITREKFYYFNQELETNEIVNFGLFSLSRMSNENQIFLATQQSSLEDVEFTNLNSINNSYNNFYQEGYFLDINLNINDLDYNVKTKLETIDVTRTSRQSILNNNIALDFINYYNSLNSILSVENNEITINLSEQNSVIRNNIFSYLGYSTIITEVLLASFLNRLYINYIVLDNKGNIKHKLNFNTTNWIQNTSSNKIFTTSLEDIDDLLDDDIVLCRLYSLKKETHDINTSRAFRAELIDTFSNNSVTELIEIADGLFDVGADYEIYIENLFRIIDKVIV